MERTPETKPTTTAHDHDSTISTPNPSFPPSPDHSLPSDLSDRSSLSHGSSPDQDKSRNPLSPPAGSSPEQEKSRKPVSSPGNSTVPEHSPAPEYWPAKSSPEVERARRADTSPGNSPEYTPARSPEPEPMVFRFAPGGTETVRKVDRGPVEGEAAKVYAGAAGEGSGGGRRTAARMSGFGRVDREETARKVGLGLRILGLFFCLISFAVMASDKRKGWAVDSFFKYKEFRYCLAMNAIGFVYSFAQASYLAYNLANGYHIFRHPLRYYFDFGMDQILTYFLMSASSSAATRVENWVTNWGSDKFPEMATASVALSYLAFLAFAANSLISGYTLCAFRST